MITRNEQIDDIVDPIYIRIRNSRDNVGVFVEGNKIKTASAQSNRFLLLTNDFPHAVCGIYTKDIVYEDFREDMVQFLEDLMWI